MTAPIRVKYVLSHPIQYFAPLLQLLAQSPELELQVIYAIDAGAEKYYDPGFDRSFRWDRPLLEGYQSHVLMPGKSFRPGLYLLSLPADGISRWIRKDTTDLMIIHGWGTRFDLAAIFSAWRQHIPILCRAEIQPYLKLSALRRKLKPVVLNPLLRRFAGFLAIGTLNRQYYLEAGVQPERIFWAPYSIDTSMFQNRKFSERDRAEQITRLGLRSDSFKVIFCGKLTPIKRPGDVIEAVARMADREAVEVLLIGDGILLPQLKQLAQDRKVQAHFLGFQNQLELPPLYSLGDVLILPSEHEPWGLVVNEAMTLGLPAIVSTVVGSGPDLVLDDISGYRCPVGDTRAMARALDRMVHSPELHRRLRQGARERVARFSLDQTLAGYLSAIQGVCHRSLPQPDPAEGMAPR